MIRVHRFARLLVVGMLVVAGCAPQPTPRPVPTPPRPAPSPAPTPPSPPKPAPTPAPTPRPTLAHAEPHFEIGLAWDLDTATVAFAGRQPLVVQSAARPASQTTAGPVQFRVSGNQLLVTPRDRRRAVPLFVLQAGDTLWLGDESWARGDEARAAWNGKHWRGRMKLFLNARGTLTLATRLPLERYLEGVVPGEIGPLSDSLVEAGRAQAVAARSYSLFYKGRRGLEGFDLFATVEDQFYSPMESERPLATHCVQSTRGLVALSDGLPIRANYCSTCGGITAEAWEAWPTTPFDYLVSHPDAESGRDWCASSPLYRWREEWSANEFEANLAKYGPPNGVPLPNGGVGDLVDVRVVARSRSARVWWLEVETTTGVMRVHAHMLRQVLRRGGTPNSILRSNLFKVGVLRDPRTLRALAVVASGSGSGHGVGLCQTGALGMARAGKRGEAIVRHYYPGAALERLY